MHNPLSKYLSFIALFFSATFFGLMVCFLIVIDRMLASLDGPTYTLIMQKLIAAADHPPLVPLMVILSVFAPIIYLILERRFAHGLAFKLTATGLALFMIAFLVTVVLNVPLNTQITSWNIANPPADWMAIRNQWHLYNIIRVLTSGTAFVLHVIAFKSLAADKKSK